MSAGDLARIENLRVDIACVEIVLCASRVVIEIRVGSELAAFGDDYDFIACDRFFADGARKRLPERPFARLHPIREGGVEDIPRPLEKIPDDTSIEQIIDTAGIPSQGAERDR